MLGAYDWAFVKPIRKLFYNMIITLVSVVVAVLIGGIEALGLLQDNLHLTGSFWTLIADLNGNSHSLGFIIIGIFIVAWIASVIVYRYNGYEQTVVKALAPGTTSGREHQGRGLIAGDQYRLDRVAERTAQ